MILGCGCLIAMLAGFAPRLVLILMWIVGDRMSAAFDTVIIPILGIIFVPYTTIFYVLVWSPVTGVQGWDWVWVAFGLMLDLMHYGIIGNNRKGVPGYPQDAY